MQHNHVCNITSITLFVGPVIFRFKKAIFRFNKREIPFQFRFIIAKIEFDEITIYPNKYSIESKLSLDENIKTEKQWFH